MLPALPVTDLMLTTPDAEGLNMWAIDFGRKSIPEGIGVYCFYDPKTGSPSYIGSGCAVHSNGVGVWRRILQYRREPNQTTCKHDRRIGQAVREQGLLLKVWLVASDGDARKYEMDAIAKYQPSTKLEHKIQFRLWYVNGPKLKRTMLVRVPNGLGCTTRVL